MKRALHKNHDENHPKKHSCLNRYKDIKKFQRFYPLVKCQLDHVSYCLYAYITKDKSQ